MPKIHGLGQTEEDRICMKMVYLERMQAELEHAHLTHKTHWREHGFNKVYLYPYPYPLTSDWVFKTRSRTFN